MKEQIKNLMRFIDNFNGELSIKKNEIYHKDKLVATFTKERIWLRE